MGFLIVGLFVLAYIVCSLVKFRTVQHYHEDMDEAVLFVKEWFPFGLRTRTRQYRLIGEVWFRDCGTVNDREQVSVRINRILTKLVRTQRYEI